MSDKVTIYTDGACLDNPGAGGWAAIMIWGEVEKILSGSEANSTNNRMELMAVIMTLESLKRPINVEINTDSKYVKNGITEWIKKWKQNDWKTANKKPVKNQDLWQRLDTATSKHKITWQWVKGHAGDPLNERCDEIAKEEALKAG